MKNQGRKLNKLVLNKQTVRALSDGEMNAAAGGAAIPYTFYCQTNKKGCLTHLKSECITTPYFYC